MPDGKIVLHLSSHARPMIRLHGIMTALMISMALREWRNMEFTDDPLEPFGHKFLTMAVPSQLSFKMAMVFRVLKVLKARGYLPPGDNRMAELCFDEALINAMQHGNRLDPNKKVRVVLFGDEQRWGATIEDEGDGFGPDQLRPRDEGGELTEETGRGILLIDGFVDQLRYSRKGNKLWMARRKQAQPDATAAPAGPATPAEALPVAEPVAPRPQATAEELELDISDDAEVMGIVEVSRDDGVTVASIRSQRIDESCRDEINDALVRCAGDARLLVVDMGEVQYISSVGLSVFISLHKRMASQNGKLVLAAVTPPAQKIFSAVGLQRVLEMAPDRAAALAAARG